MDTLRLTAGPVFDTVVVTFTTGELNELTIMDKVVSALEGAGEYKAASAFLHSARLCDTDDELLALADGYVTLVNL